MFSPTPDPSRPATRSLRAAIRNAADLAIAFVTLESYGLDDLRPARASTADGHPGSTPADDAAARPGASGTRRAAVAHPHRTTLRPQPRPGRPGTSPRREQLCLTPLRGTGAPAAAPASRRRTAPQDAPH